MFIEINSDINVTSSCILKPTNYLLNAHKCFVYSCKTSNSVCIVSIKFSFLKLLSCTLGFLSGVFTIYEFTNELLTEEVASMFEIYLKLLMISCGFIAVGNSFLWNVKIKELEKSIRAAVYVEKVAPYRFEDLTIPYKSVLRSIVFYWIQLIMFVILIILELVFLERKHVYYKIFSLVYLNLLTCVFLELRHFLNWDLCLKNRFKKYVEIILKDQIDNGKPGDHHENLKVLQNLYPLLPIILERFKNYLSLILPYFFVTFIPVLITYFCMIFEITVHYEQISMESVIMVLIVSIYGVPGVLMAAQVVKSCDNLALFVSDLLTKR